MPEWTQSEVRDWVIKRCWNEHLQNPAGFGMTLQPADLSKEDPSWGEILQATEHLMGKYRVTGDYGRAMGSKGPIYINKLRLTQEAIARIQDKLESEPDWEPGFLPD